MKKFLFLIALFTLMGGANSVKAEEVKIPIELKGTVPGVTVVALDPENNYAELPENPEHIYAAKFTSSGQFQNAFQIKPMPVTDALAAGCDRIIIELDDVEAGWNFHAYGGQQNYSEIAAGTKQIKLMLEGTGDIDDFTIFTLWASSPKVFKVKAAYFYKPDDPLADEKAALSAKIDRARMYNALAYTGASFSALTGEITTAEAALAAAASSESLTTATANLQARIDGLVLRDGFTNLTEDMFKHWNDNDVPTIAENTGCEYVLNESTGQPYGDGSVGYLNFADVSDFSKLIVTGGNGTPRIMMNRQDPIEPGQDGYDPNGGAYVQFTDVFVDAKKEVDLTAYGYAHINAIKGANWANVTVTGMFLYRTINVGATGYATFGSLYKNAKPNGVKAYAAKYEGGQVTLTPVTNVPAGKGVVIEAAEGSYAPTFDVAADNIDSDLKVSNGTVVGDGSTIYVLNKVADKVGFYLLKAGNTLEAGKAYLKIEDGVAKARAFIGISGMDVTGISTVKQAEGKKDDVIYNLNGQRVSNPRKGLFIKNGVKFLAD